ncbi:MAG: serine protease [Oscillatoria sp. PMC 1051.18]|nr:serine protease [Oscillatoria sp. PMC 1050.18]MEC5029238.1 serine protease [Oscillatoria sp. PMC 1051.18]
MAWSFQIIVASIGSLLIGLSVEIFYLSTFPQGEVQETNPEQTLPAEISAEQLHQLAESITVKVLSGENWGSGIIIQKKGQTYTVVTNNHVLIFGNGSSYPVQTPDGQIYTANLVKTIDFDGNDLGLLQFQSDKNYTIASLADSSILAVDQEVFAAGFPFEADESKARGFVFTIGKVELVINKVLVGGYQIGYSNEIQKGMSGGPLLNSKGQVIGINSMHKYPLWGNPYVFQDGSVASEAMRQEMSQLSWAVPIQTLLTQAPQFADRNNFSERINLRKPPKYIPGVSQD